MILVTGRDLARRRLSDDHEDTEAESLLLTAVDLEDTWNDEKGAFKLAPTTTGMIRFTNIFMCTEFSLLF